VHDLLDVRADREEPGREGLGELRPYLPGVLFHSALVDVDVLELERRDCPSRAQVRMVKATRARSRRWISVTAGIIRPPQG
jgi:hypothetical protein